MPRLRRILLAEDSARDVELTLTALAEHNLANEVDVVRDGAEALDYIYCRDRYAGRSAEQPSVILLDIKMPKIDGIEVLRRLKADEQYRTIPIVMLTSSREESDLIASYRLNVNAYVVKPVDFAEFLEAVKNLGVFWALVNELPQQGTGPNPVA